MTQITIEMVDDVMERLPNVSYKDAKEALIKTDGNVLDAIILLDGDKKFSISAIKKDGLDNIGTKFTAETEKLRRQTIELLKTAKRVRLIVDSEERTILNLPLGVGILGIATLPIPTVLGLSAAVLTNCTVKIADENSDDQVEFGVMTPEKMDMLKEILTNSFDEVKKTLENKKETKKDNDDDSDITDELLNEENK
ncbi:DUF4342 domain-containing protein [Peptostreptococcus russellii]|uniref:DUF4342 domain-containing protein n=1 Tax=Peptostreptococcus russellii TaxID=215200 RepID=A0A1H8FAG9_9FIRM|nr:DUF4342 domain-containing protein [Peptostreptococcus russellii]MBC2577280.1 DUF4342 domain-containing protein [Peptostreptococcus russellii]SEN28576.1 protein of unknown function [Peptostreptococcus russellii]